MDVQAVLDTIAADAGRGDMVFPTHAEIALRVRRILDDPDCSIDQLHKLISAEPLLSARVVGLANSVAYNPSGRVSSDLRSAVSRLGFNTLRTLATALVVRQMRDMSGAPEHRALAARLWEHTAHVAALARVIAKRITGQDPEAAFFAGIVHEVGGFYLLSRAAAFPGLLTGNLDAWHEHGVPAPICTAIEAMWEGYLALPPESLGDTLLLADELAPTESPLAELSDMGRHGVAADIDVLIGEEMLNSILKDSAEEVASLISALNA
ncbi:HDOD domain-containing protein [Dechloromonas denitrificans]|uniref:HDOD domain-containing protein n=1 Tax=Dechloromonas denitrificans TaxID=281362 RepID=UPI001CF85F87|nr:HDOD domain-containing protein [Dechloromonas denitrificans]UCV04181.1 HDOD domain-containing protein [Dechloromonas denitrificans]